MLLFMRYKSLYRKDAYGIIHSQKIITSEEEEMRTFIIGMVVLGFMMIAGGAAYAAEQGLIEIVADGCK
jgi:hypothetical protein